MSNLMWTLLSFKKKEKKKDGKSQRKEHHSYSLWPASIDSTALISGLLQLSFLPSAIINDDLASFLQDHNEQDRDAEGENKPVKQQNIFVF